MWSDRCHIVPFIEINEVIHNDLVLVQVFCKLYSHTYTHMLHFNCAYMGVHFFDMQPVRELTLEHTRCLYPTDSGGTTHMRSVRTFRCHVLGLRWFVYLTGSAKKKKKKRSTCIEPGHALNICTYILNDDDMHLTLVGWWQYVTRTFRAPGKFSGRWWMTTYIRFFCSVGKELDVSLLKQTIKNSVANTREM